MKKIKGITACILATLCLTACGAKTPTASPTPSPTQSNETVVGSGDKISETSYAGKVNIIDGDTMTIIVDKKETVEFKLTDKAKKDITDFDVKMGNRVVVDFETLTDGTKSAINVNIIKDEL